MDEPQNDLIEQIISASLAKQSASWDKAPAGDGPPDAPDSEDGPQDAPDPAEAPPKAKEQPPPNPEQPKAEPPKAGKALVGLTAALAIAAAALLIVCLAQFKAHENTVAGLREAAADIQAIDGLRTENQQLQQELNELQRELTDTQTDLWIAQNRAEYQERSYNDQVSQSSALWACLVARDIYARGDPEGCAAALKVLLNNIEYVANEQGFIRGYEYRLWEMMTELVDKLRTEGYLSQGEADTLNNKFSDIDLITLEGVQYGWTPN